IRLGRVPAMASSDDSVPEPVHEKLETGPTDTPLPPEEAKEIVDEIKALAESRGDDSEVIEKLDLEIPATGPHPVVPPNAPEEDDHLSPDELRDAWPLLDLE